MSSSRYGCHGQQRPFFYSPYQAGIDFSLITEERKKGRGVLSTMPNATQNVTGDKGEVGTGTEYKKADF